MSAATNDPIIAYGEGLGASLAQSLATRLADALAGDVPSGVTIASNDAQQVTLTGVDLLHRYMSDVRLYSIPMIASSLSGESL